MDWIGISEFKSDFKAAKQAKDSQVQMALDAAVDELVELVGQSAVDDALADTPVDATRADRVVRAHKFLSISIFLFNVDTVKRQQNAGSPAIAGGMITDEYYTPKELGELSDRWRAIALRAIGGYLIQDVAGDDYGPAIEYVHPAEVSSCRKRGIC